MANGKSYGVLLGYATLLRSPSHINMPPILLAVFHCSLYREHITSPRGSSVLFRIA